MMATIEEVIHLIRELRAEEKGCAWTQVQTFSSLAPQTIEEAYELAEAIELDDKAEIKSEIGDLLYHILFYALIGEEQGLFSLSALCQEIISKHQTRMPDLQTRKQLDAEQTNLAWQRAKAAKRKSVVENIPQTLPALTRAVKLNDRVSAIGFDWDNPQQVINKVREELDELESSLESGHEKQVQDELGDVLFACANLSRHLKTDAETALRHANRKFIERFQILEGLAKERNLKITELTFNELDALWQEVKASSSSV